MNDTWKTGDLEKSLKRRDRDEGSERRRRRDDDDGHRERRDRDREKTDRHKDERRRDKEKDRDGDREKRRDRDEGREKRRDRDGDREKRRDKDGDREKRRDRDEDRDRKKDRDRDGDRKERRDRDGDREKRRDGDREKRKDGDREKRKDGDREKGRDGDREKRRDRDSHKDGDRDRDGDRRHREEDDEERRRRKKREAEGDRDREKDSERRHRDRDDDKRRRHKDEDDVRDRDRKHKDSEDRDRRRKHKDEDDREKRHRRKEEDDKDGDREKRHRKKGEEGRGDEDKKHRRRRGEDDEEDETREKRKEEERRRRREEKQKQKEAEEQERREREGREQKEQKEKKAEEEKTGGGDDDYGDYDDDFEDYDDDFEDEDDEGGDARGRDRSPTPPPRKSRSEMDEVLQAMDDENDKLLRMREQEDEEKVRKSRPIRNAPSGRSFINFVAAQQRQMSSKQAGKTRSRFYQLSKLIELDVASFDMLDLAPVEEYELYMRNMGRSNMKQARVQTNDDCIEKEIQTDEIELRQKWTQHPPEDFKGSGDGKSGDYNSETGEMEEQEVSRSQREHDAVRLTRFLQTAGQVMAVLVEEDNVGASREGEGGVQRSGKSSVSFTDGCSNLARIPFLEGRYAERAEFSAVQSQLLLTTLSQDTKASTNNSLAKQGYLCVWNVNEPLTPQKILMCESQPRCCCFSPHKATLAFAGLQDGSVTVWDLREHSSSHRSVMSGEDSVAVRSPTYTTASLAAEECHASPVRAIVPIVAAAEKSGSGKSEDDSDSGSGLSFQLATLEEAAVISFWTVAEIPNPDPAGSQFDLGLAPGGRVKIIKSSSIVLESPVKDLRYRSPLKALDMRLNPRDPNHLYVGTDSGHVVHVVRYGGKSPPKFFRSDIEVPLNVNCIDFSPLGLGGFLVGCGDGSIRLYRLSCDLPVITWPNSTNGVEVTCVKWSTSRAAVFYVVDANSNLHVWDLTQSDVGPVKSEKVKDGRLLHCVISHDHAATGLGAPGSRPHLALCLDSGTEVHLPPQALTSDRDDFRVMMDVLKRSV